MEGGEKLTLHAVGLEIRALPAGEPKAYQLEWPRPTVTRRSVGAKVVRKPRREFWLEIHMNERLLQRVILAYYRYLDTGGEPQAFTSQMELAKWLHAQRLLTFF